MDTTQTQDQAEQTPIATQRYILCRTKADGWQDRGFVLMVDYLPAAKDGRIWPDTVWVEDNSSHYQPQDVYPLPSESAPQDGTK
ncbi:hypothetical protein GS501_02360 [Saccharibacter sp. 17.LH.SD]|uniref:hypothetical protein n=1 Tax=Saccharibacter sp. 17.LH.SD TaxID=2689393 RepID=UPI00136E9CD3|nr:hypothetical protein [Saccharibacter sp. 17.LH.SD]MXV43895.1 hypothetical protein [Saccharibacter sp. 17.LH.SD]